MNYMMMKNKMIMAGHFIVLLPYRVGKKNQQPLRLLSHGATERIRKAIRNACSFSFVNVTVM